MRDKVYCGMLNAYYGSMLTEHQKEILRLYYDCDMSLGEIGDLMGVSRQAVREIIVRSTDKLSEWEEKLGLIEKVRKISNRLESIIDTANDKSVEEIKESLSALMTEIKEI